MLKVALVGVGSMGSGHYDQYKKMQDVQLVALCDIREERIAEKCKEIGARGYTNMDALLAHEELDFVDIVTPSDTHIDLAVKALEKGISVLCEKPAALSIGDIQRVYQCARDHHAIFMAAHVLRFWPEYQWLKNAIQQENHGKLLNLTMVRRGGKPTGSWDNWMMSRERSGVGPYDLHIHDVDLMVHMLGKPEGCLHCNLHQEKADGEIKTSMIDSVYTYPGNVHVHIQGGWCSGKIPFIMKYEALFDDGMAIFENGKLTWYPNDQESYEIKPEACTPGHEPEMYTDGQGYYNEIRYFKRCLEENLQPDMVKEEELITVLELLESATGIHR